MSAEYIDDRGQEPTWLKLLGKYWHILMSAVFIITACYSLSRSVEDHEKRICKVESHAEKITEMKTDIKWIKKYLEDMHKTKKGRGYESIGED